MAATVFSVIFLLIAIGVFAGAQFGMPKQLNRVVGGRYGSTQEVKNWGRTWVKIGSLAFVPLAAITFIASGFQSVPTKSVGVLTSFGRVQGTPYGPGSHWMVPWKTLNVVTDTIQSDSFFQSNNTNGTPNPDSYTNSGAHGYCIMVRLGGQNEGCADVQLQTQTNENAIPNLFANYSSYGPNLTQDVDQYVVKRDLTTTLNRVLGDYNPIMDVSQQLEACDLKAAANCQTTISSQFSRFDPQLVSALQQILGDQVKVFDVNLQYIHYDTATENALKKIQESYLGTAQAVQQEQTNAAISLANAALVKNNSLSPAVLANECYTTTQDAIKAGYNLPAGWSCSGSNSSLLINGK